MHEFCKVVTFDDDFIAPPNAIPINESKVCLISVYSTCGLSKTLCQSIQKLIVQNCTGYEIYLLGKSAVAKIAKTQISEFFENQYFDNLSKLKMAYENSTEEHNIYIIFGLCSLSAVLPSNFVYCDLTSNSWLKTLQGAINGS